MRKIDELISAAKEVLRIHGAPGNWTSCDNLRAAVEAVESAKPGKRLELVEIAEKDIDKSDSSQRILTEVDGRFYHIEWDQHGEFWYTKISDTETRFTPAKFFRLAHPAEQDGPMVSILEAHQYFRTKEEWTTWAAVAKKWTESGVLEWTGQGSFKDQFGTIYDLTGLPEVEACVRAQIAAKDLNAGKVKIGNDKWAKYGDRVYYAAWNITKPRIIAGELLTGVRAWCFVTEREAEDFMASKDLVKVADGWVDLKTKTPVYRVSRGLECVETSHALALSFRRAPETYFRDKSAARAALRAERLKAGWRETADGGWVRPGEKCWLVAETPMRLGTHEDTHGCTFVSDPVKAGEFIKERQ